MRVYTPFRYVSDAGHITRIAEGHHDRLPQAAVEEGERQGAFSPPVVKARQSAPRNKGGRRRARA
jgi:hypothetical protein